MNQNIFPDELLALRLQELRRKYPVFVLGGVRFKYKPIKSGRTVDEDLSIGKERCDAADGAIVGTRFKQNGRTSAPIDSDRVRQFMNIVKQVRESQE